MSATQAAGGSFRLGGRLVTVIVIAVVAVAIAAAVLLLDRGTEGKATIDAGSKLPAVGAVPPGFTVKTPDGQTVKLSDFAGKPVWLTFGGSWCPDCRSEAADLEATYKAFAPKGLVLLQVFVRDTAQSASEFARMYGFTFNQGLDPNEDLAYGYGVIGYPTHFFIGRDGTIRAERSGRLSTTEMANLATKITE
jgi:cytochrome c biogenesis protein CcmG/thiol:disulfide interchange protein DsbE